MASGQEVVQIQDVMPTGANSATPDIRIGGSTPAEHIPVWDFDATVIEYLDFKCLLLDNYAGGGLTWTLPWMASTATANEVRWGVAVRRIADDAEDVDSSHTYDYNDVDDTAPSASGEFSYPTVSMTDGADMDSWAKGEEAIVRVRRNATHANDDMAGDSELVDLIGRET